MIRNGKSGMINISVALSAIEEIDRRGALRYTLLDLKKPRSLVLL